MTSATRTVVVTGVGAAGQLGEALARAFGQTRCAVAIVARASDQAAARAAALAAEGFEVAGYDCDLANPDAVVRLAARVREDRGAIHAVVHAAGGFAMSGPIADASPEIWQQQITINLTTAFAVARAFVPALRETRGTLLFFASQAALPGTAGPRMSAYVAAKGGLIALLHAVAAEERANGVRVNAIAPGAVRTASNVASMRPDSPFVEREDVAALAVYLASDAARLITGQVIPIG
jgi:NAD(P)-dependent dehydrogenase (short-subunit alcohol dehydrogenase family)